MTRIFILTSTVRFYTRLDDGIWTAWARYRLPPTFKRFLFPFSEHNDGDVGQLSRCRRLLHVAGM